MRCYLTYLIIFLLALPAAGQSKRERLRAKVDSLLTQKYYRVTYDTNYIGRPKGRLTLKARVNLSGNSVHAKSDDMSAELNTDRKATLSFGISYRGLSAGLAINPASLSGRNKDYELNVNLYTNRLSIDASYQMSKTMAGYISRYGNDYTVERGWVNTKMLNIAGYYTFNHRRFSYPAAFTQSYIQKHSCGSWLAGFSFQGGSMKTTGEGPEDMPEARFYMGHFAIGGGYGYNLVARQWLFHLSLLPTLAVYTGDNITVNGQRQYADSKFPTVILNSRAAIVRNIGERHFVGVTVVSNHLLKSTHGTDLRQSKWRVRAFYGIRF